MELKDLYPFIIGLILVSMLVGIGTLTLDKFGTVTYNTDTVTNESLTWGVNNTETALGHGNITGITSVYIVNHTLIPSTDYSLNDSTLGEIAFLSNETVEMGNSTKVTYVYKEYGTTTNTAMRNVTDALTAIPSTWLGLIVTVVVLALILGIVITSFQNRR